MRRFMIATLGASLTITALAAAGCREPADEPSERRALPQMARQGEFKRPDLGEGEVGRASIEVDPRDPESLYRAGQELFLASQTEGSIRSAEEHFRRSVNLKPTAKAYHALGEALMLQSRFSDAADAFQNALELEPAKRLSWQRRAKCQLAAGRPNAAIQTLRKMVEQIPDDASVVRELADALVIAERDAEAIEVLQKAIAREPSGAAKDYKLIGELHARGEQWEQAIPAFRESARLHPDPGIFGDLAHAQVRMGDFDGALASFEEVARLDPTDPSAPETVGELMLRKGDLAGARAAFEASLKIRQTASAQLALGRLSLKENKKDEALERMEKALRAARTDIVDERREVAMFAMELGELETAEKVLVALADAEEKFLAAAKQAGLGRLRLAHPVRIRQLSLPVAPSLFLDLAKVRQARKDDEGVKLACEKAKALLPADDNSPCPPK